MQQVAMKFVQWDVPELEKLKGCRVYQHSCNCMRHISNYGTQCRSVHKRCQEFGGSRASNRKSIHCITTGYTPFLWLPRITRLSDRGCMFLFLFSCRYFFMGLLIGGRIAPPCRSCCHTWMHVASASLTFSSCFLEYIHPARLSPL